MFDLQRRVALRAELPLAVLLCTWNGYLSRNWNCNCGYLCAACFLILGAWFGRRDGGCGARCLLQRHAHVLRHGHELKLEVALLGVERAVVAIVLHTRFSCWQLWELWLH